MRSAVGFLTIAAATTVGSEARSGRPFFTDDAGAVGGATLQLEDWLHVRRALVEHWAIGAFGPVDFVELSGGLASAVTETDGWRPALAGGVLQAKFLGREPTPGGVPGVACALGAVLPVGTGAFEPDGWRTYTYLAFTEEPLADGRLALHVNVGGAFALEGPGAGGGILWGVAGYLRVVAGFGVMAEVFSAEPIADSSAIAVQHGVVFELSEHVQLDATFGATLSGEAPRTGFGTAGVKLVTDPLW